MFGPTARPVSRAHWSDKFGTHEWCSSGPGPIPTSTRANFVPKSPIEDRRRDKGRPLRHLRAHLLLVSVAAAILLSIALVQFADALSPPGSNISHATGHLAIAVPTLLLACSIASWCPRRKDTRAARWGRRAAITGLGMITVGLILEAIGAFGYDGDDSRIAALTTLHNASWLIQFPGVPVLLVGILLGFYSVVQRTPDPTQTTT